MKSKIVAGLLGIFLGAFGVHRFYLGQPLVGLFYLFFCWTMFTALAGFVEGIMFLVMSEGRFNRKYNKTYQVARITNSADEIEKLHRLQESGVISTEEFKKRKVRLLD